MYFKSLLLIVSFIILNSCSSDSVAQDIKEVTEITPEVSEITPLTGFTFESILLDGKAGFPPKEQSWELIEVLTDEFDQTNGIDVTKWDDFHPHWVGRKPSNFKKGNAFVKDGMLQLKSTLRVDPSKVNDPNVDVWVDAAACVSKKNSAVVGNYYEASIKASSLSMTSSFWFRVGKFSEIDVIEHIGNQSNPLSKTLNVDLSRQYHSNTFYYGKHNGLKLKKSDSNLVTPARDSFHVFGFWWKDASTLWFYLDGKKTHEIITRVPFDEPLKMIFDTEVFAEYSGEFGLPGLPKVENLNDNTKNTMFVDFVRSYKVAVPFVSGILSNGGFENQNTNWLGKGKVNLITETSEVYAGAFSMQLKDGGSIIQKIDVSKNTDYQLKWTSKLAKGTFRIEILDIDSDENTNIEWMENSLDFNSEEKDSIYVKFTASENSSVMIDDISLLKK